MKLAFPLLVSLIPLLLAADSESTLKPLLATPDQIVLQDDFSKAGPVKREEWQKRQGTRWSVEEGVLRGIPSSAEYQASKSHHRGLEPRVSVPKTPAEFVARFSVRFFDGEETSIVPFVEFGHHVCRLKLSQESGLSLIADSETVQLAAAQNFLYVPGRWYHALAELKGEEFVIRFEDGPTLYARHPCFAQPAPSGGNGLGIAGPRGGTAEVDDVTIWSISGDEQPNWSQTRDTLPVFEPVPTGKVKKPKKS